MPDPANVLHPETQTQLRHALSAQREAGLEPTNDLRDAIRAAAREARERQLAPEAILIQLKVLSEEIGLPMPHASTSRNDVRTWMVTTLLRAYWENSERA